MTTPQRPSVRLLVFSASLRSGSLNTKLAQLFAHSATERGAIIDMASFRDFDCPSYDGDLETRDGVPAGAQALHQRISANDAFVIVSPEYNGSMPGTLKNVIDWTSRIRPQPYDSRHALLMSASPSMGGGNRGLWQLRIPLEHLGTRVFPDMFSLAMAHKAFDGERIADIKLQQRFDATVGSFLELVEAAKHYPCVKRAWVEFLGQPPGEAGDRVDAKA